MMQIIQRKPADLKGYARNARTHDDAQIGQIAASIREYGFNNPILIDETDTIIAGHGRLSAALRLGLESVPCIILAHLTDAQRRAYIIADNKISLNSGWDKELLAIELSALEGLEISLAPLGWSQSELDHIMSSLDDPIPVLESAGDMSGSNYGDARSAKIPVNVLGVGGMVDRELMVRVKEWLLAGGASSGEDNGEIIGRLYLAALGE